MELRLMCDEANDIEMIEAFKQGRDFHQETADMAGVPRNLAKNGRFAKLYGAGVKRVADTLGVAMDVAKKICSAIDGSSPRVAEYTRELIAYADVTACGYNWLGRRYFFNMDKRGTFRYPNYRIQGGCGEILRFSIIEVGRFLRKEARPETFMLIPIHDEIVFNIHKDDLRLLPEIKRIMIGAHKSKRSLDMDVGVMVGPNFYDLEEIK
jgi:DNA polymerase-1